MSLLTDTQGTPERVWSTMSAVAAANGLLDRDDLQALLNPNFVRNGQERAPTDSAPKQAIGASVSLGLITLENGRYRLGVEPAPDYATFTDRVHARLCSINASDPDYLVLETYAWMLLEIDKRQSLLWTAESAPNFAKAAENDIGNPVGGELRINPTKITPWQRWIQVMDLAIDLPGNLGFYPTLTGRLVREIEGMDLPKDTEIPFGNFLAAAARAMPYIDGGALHELVLKKTGQKTDSRRLSRLLSMGLRDLADASRIELVIRGDAINTFELAADDRPAASVLGIVLKGASS